MTMKSRSWVRTHGRQGAPDPEFANARVIRHHHDITLTMVADRMTKILGHRVAISLPSDWERGLARPPASPSGQQRLAAWRTAMKELVEESPVSAQPQDRVRILNDRLTQAGLDGDAGCMGPDPWTTIPLAILEEMLDLIFMFARDARMAAIERGPVTLALMVAQTPRELAQTLHPKEPGDAHR